MRRSGLWPHLKPPIQRSLLHGWCCWLHCMCCLLLFCFVINLSCSWLHFPYFVSSWLINCFSLFDCFCSYLYCLFVKYFFINYSLLFLGVYFIADWGVLKFIESFLFFVHHVITWPRCLNCATHDVQHFFHNYWYRLIFRSYDLLLAFLATFIESMSVIVPSNLISSASPAGVVLQHSYSF